MILMRWKRYGELVLAPSGTACMEHMRIVPVPSRINSPWTGIQILFAYKLSRDDRLARRCIREFYASRCDDGLLETHLPVPFRIVSILQFSLYWILMIHDQMGYFNDMMSVRQYIGTIDGIPDHFHCQLTPRDPVGCFDNEAWPFID